MSEKVEQKKTATFLNSVALTVNTSNGLRHVQISLFENDLTHEVQAFFDVVDPSTVKLNK